MNPCECGCGSKANPGYRFINGHNRRGKKCFEQSERMISNNPMKRPEVIAKFKGKKNPSLSERNRKQTGKNNPCFGRTKEKHPMWGKKRPDFKKWLIENNPSKRPEQIERMENGDAAYMSSCNKNPSKPQVKLYEMVKLLYPSAILNYLYGKYCIDIAIPEPKIAIEYDGGYWHQDKEKDVKRQKELEERGWRFIRYKDHTPTEESLIKDICQD
jgi:hypothetical protein